VIIYTAEVYTGAGQQFGNDVSVHLQMFGKYGDTGCRLLHTSTINDIPFRSGQMDTFEIEAVYLGTVEQIVVSVRNAEAESTIFFTFATLKNSVWKYSKYQPSLFVDSLHS
jgi:hypothetical protein